jgi:hypothetical protein
MQFFMCSVRGLCEKKSCGSRNLNGCLKAGNSHLLGGQQSLQIHANSNQRNKRRSIAKWQRIRGAMRQISGSRWFGFSQISLESIITMAICKEGLEAVHSVPSEDGAHVQMPSMADQSFPVTLRHPSGPLPVQIGRSLDARTNTRD